VFSFADMLAATAATGTKTAVGIEWIVEGRHETSCHGRCPLIKQGTCQPSSSAIALMSQGFAASLVITKIRDKRKFVA
jgi:hypothetical protein